MKRSLFLFLTSALSLLLCIGSVRAQELIPTPNEKNALFGYTDSVGVFVIKPVYDMAGNFSDQGVALVQFKGKYGYIDRKGADVVEPRYSWVDTKYDDFGLCKVAIGGTFDEKLGQMKGSTWGYIDHSLKEVIPAKYDQIDPFDSLGICRVNIGGSYNAKLKDFYGGKYGYINVKGQELTPVKYTSADTKFIENRAGVGVGTKLGYIDRSGKEITPLKYKAIYPFRNGKATVDFGKLLGAVDSTGREIAPAKYTSMGLMIDGCAMVAVSAGKNVSAYGYIDITGVEVVKPIYKSVRREFREERSAVFNGSKWAVIDNKGKVLTPFEFDWVENCVNGFTPVNKGGKRIADKPIEGGKWGFVDRDGKAVSKIEYSKLHGFNELGLAMVCDGSSWGWIDGTGAEIIPLVYTAAADFKDGLAPVKCAGKGFMWIDTNNNPVIETNYRDGSQFIDGIAFVQGEDKLWGGIDRQKNVLIPLLFTAEEVQEVRDDVFLKDNKGEKPISPRQAKLYKLYKYRPQNEFKMVDVIPDNLWDF